MKKLKEILIGKHYLIERFGIIFTTLTLALGILAGTMLAHRHKIRVHAAEHTYMYTAEVKSSLSGLRGKVVNIWRNDNKTKAFILLKFEDTANMSTDADMYQMMLCGSTLNMQHEVIQSNPSSAIYVYGTTGYLGIYFEDRNGFPNQILRLIVRMDRRMSSAGSSGGSSVEDSFKLHDQFELYFNPYGSDAPTARFLYNDGPLNMSDVFYEAVIYKGEWDARDYAMRLLRDMAAIQTRIREYEFRVRRDGIVLPELPETIAGDKIVAYYEGQPIEMTARENYVYPDGHPQAGQVIPDHNLVFRLETDFVFPGCYNYEWYDGYIQKGYIADVTGGQDIRSYLADMAVLRRDPEVNRPYAWEGYKHWYYESGAEFTYDPVYDTAAIADIKADIDLLANAYADYYVAKKAYQQYIEQFLKLEQEYRESGTVYSVNNKLDSLSLW